MMRKTLFSLLLIMFLGIGYILGQNQASHNGGMDQELETSPQKTIQPSAEKEQRGHSGNTSQPNQSTNQDDVATKALGELLLRALAKGVETEPEKPSHEIVDFSPDTLPTSEPTPQHLEQFLTLTQEELEEDFIRNLPADVRPPDETINDTVRRFAELREAVKEELAKDPLFVPPPPVSN